MELRRLYVLAADEAAEFDAGVRRRGQHYSFLFRGREIRMGGVHATPRWHVRPDRPGPGGDRPEAGPAGAERARDAEQVPKTVIDDRDSPQARTSTPASARARFTDPMSACP